VCAEREREMFLKNHVFKYGVKNIFFVKKFIFFLCKCWEIIDNFFRNKVEGGGG
jgi:hypothetical protein